MKMTSCYTRPREIRASELGLEPCLENVGEECRGEAGMAVVTGPALALPLQ